MENQKVNEEFVINHCKELINFIIVRPTGFMDY